MSTKTEPEINRLVILAQKQMTMRRIAHTIGVTPAAITFTMRGENRSRKMHERICDILGVSLEEFWPEFYFTSQSNDKLN